MELTWEKWLVMGALALLSALFGIFPYLVLGSKFIHSKTPSGSSMSYKIVLTILSCFGGGVLLVTAFVHMLSEAREDLSGIPQFQNLIDENFPLAELLTLVGFSVIYLVEEIAHFMLNHDEHGSSCSQLQRRPSVASSISLSHRKMSMSSCKDGSNTRGDHVIGMGSGSFDEPKVTRQSISSSLRSILALIALSFHAIMEGVAIGIEDSTGLWFMFGAVASHKFVISFCMGMELFGSGASRKTYFGSIVFFAVVSPLGILIGSLVSGGNVNLLPIAIVKGLATGTLLYVVFFEILSREKERQTNGYFENYTRISGFIQFASLFVGMLAMAILVTQTEEGHSHHHNGELDDLSDRWSSENPDGFSGVTQNVLADMTQKLLT